ncbi:hypothetical protein BDW22DRAFT_1402641 [Trametopsis cervina]|nr:hypothetical protein BDW22DRAFT_1402641 [Trametopsis cervina]
MLGHLLVMTLREAEASEQMVHDQTSARELLHECLHDVHRLCEDEELRRVLRACTEKKETEDEWDTLLIRLVNTAFDKLDTLQPSAPDKGIARLRKVSKGPQSVLLARLANHARPSPDLVLITATTASEIYKNFNISQFTLSPSARHSQHHVLSNAPDKAACLWHEVLSSFEVQGSQNRVKTKLREPPLRYTVPAKMDSHMTGDGFETFLEAGKGVVRGVLMAGESEECTGVPDKLRKKRPMADSDSLPKPPEKRSRMVESSSPQASETVVDDDTNTTSDGWNYPLKMVAYATERLGSLPVVTHSLGVLFKDDVFRLWWYDRQGVIQTDGINFIQDLPRFLVFLLAIHRFNEVNWGIPLGFPTTPVHDCISDNQQLPRYVPTTQSCIRFPANGGLPETTVTVIWKQPLHSAYEYSRRATTVYKVEYKDDATRSFIMKVSNPDQHRLPEGEIIERARQLKLKTVKGDSVNKFDHKKHLPFVLCHMEVKTSDTTIVRKALGLDYKMGRIMRITVFEELHPFVEQGFKPKDLFRCWLEAVHCHYLLWANGIEHTDPSLENLRIRKVGSTGTPYGVLNDFDLAITPGQSRCLGEATGTMPFMAVDLLCTEFWEKGLIRRVYRHDLEGLLWVLAWIVLRLDASNDFKEALSNPFDMNDWTADNVVTVWNSKIGLLAANDGGSLQPQAWWQSSDAEFVWTFVSQSLNALSRRSLAYRLEKSKEHRRELEPETAAGLNKKYHEKQFAPAGEYSSMQLEYLFIWANIREACGDQYYEELKDAVGMDLDLPAADVAPALSQFVANPF